MDAVLNIKQDLLASGYSILHGILKGEVSVILEEYIALNEVFFNAS